ncbi:abscission/NoCut checkpoint regulator isoform X1 [Monodelphis domestica]|uniref:Abscission/NoCut checkpoint regulator n=1 Tax=Monodelphis domestica TaxID=13616 RepID=F6SZ52_MONDO|nr:abscission/NoCut checkpoint regulator isoform X1 [Monodelphis domestica]
MESRCYGCAVKFSLFRKECGCKNCGRAFCSNCLSFSTAVPRFGNTQQKVCKPCYEVLTRGPSEASVSKWSPPENYKKRVAALETKQKLIASRGLVQPQGLTQEDQVIAKRLEKLRQETKPKVAPSQAEIEARLAALRNDPPGPIPSTEEMEDRLAVLQGRVPPSQAPRLVHQPPDTRTQAQQAEDLLTQLAAEVAIDESCDPETSASNRSLQNDLNRDSPRGWNMNPAELAPQQLQGEKGRLLAEAAAELREENTREERILALAKQLAVLRGQDPERVTLQDFHFPDSDEEEEEAIQRVLGQLMEEAALEEASGFNIPAKRAPPPKPKALAVAPEAQSEVEEELPWCCICNEDATLRCYGCDGDLYCARCFREGHDAYERKEHRTATYRPPAQAGSAHQAGAVLRIGPAGKATL